MKNCLYLALGILFLSAGTANALPFAAPPIELVDYGDVRFIARRSLNNDTVSRVKSESSSSSESHTAWAFPKLIPEPQPPSVSPTPSKNGWLNWLTPKTSTIESPSSTSPVIVSASSTESYSLSSAIPSSTSTGGSYLSSSGMFSSTPTSSTDALTFPIPSLSAELSISQLFGSTGMTGPSGSPSGESTTASPTAIKSDSSKYDVPSAFSAETSESTPNYSKMFQMPLPTLVSSESTDPRTLSASSSAQEAYSVSRSLSISASATSILSIYSSGESGSASSQASSMDSSSSDYGYATKSADDMYSSLLSSLMSAWSKSVSDGLSTMPATASVSSANSAVPSSLTDNKSSLSLSTSSTSFSATATVSPSSLDSTANTSDPSGVSSSASSSDISYTLTTSSASDLQVNSSFLSSLPTASISSVSSAGSSSSDAAYSSSSVSSGTIYHITTPTNTISSIPSSNSSSSGSTESLNLTTVHSTNSSYDSTSIESSAPTAFHNVSSSFPTSIASSIIATSNATSPAIIDFSTASSSSSKATLPSSTAHPSNVTSSELTSSASASRSSISSDSRTPYTSTVSDFSPSSSASQFPGTRSSNYGQLSNTTLVLTSTKPSSESASSTYESSLPTSIFTPISESQQTFTTPTNTQFLSYNGTAAVPTNTPSWSSSYVPQVTTASTLLTTQPATISNWLPTEIVAATEDPNTLAPSASKTKPTTTPNPSQEIKKLPQFIAGSTDRNPSPNHTLITIGFKRPLNYPFVVLHPVSSAQIFDFLPKVLSFPFDYEDEGIYVKQLIPLMAGTRDYYVTIAEVWFPTKKIGELAKLIEDENSKFYESYDLTGKSLASLVDSKIPLTGIFGDNISTGPGNSIVTSHGQGSSLANNNLAGSPEHSDSSIITGAINSELRSNSKNSLGEGGMSKGKITGIVVGSVFGVAAYVAIMAMIVRYVVVRRSDPNKPIQLYDTNSFYSSNTGGSAEMLTQAGYPHFYDAKSLQQTAYNAQVMRASVSPSMKVDNWLDYNSNFEANEKFTHSCNNGRITKISGPIATENSLGWDV